MTPTEIETARAVKLLWPEAINLYRQKDAILVSNSNDNLIARFNADKMPSMQKGDRVAIEDALGDGADEV